MNAVVVAVVIMLILSLSRVNVVLALVIGAIAGGLTGGLAISETIKVFTEGLGGAEVALSYALLGGFAVAIARTGLPDLLVGFALRLVGRKGESRRASATKLLLILVILIISISSQNLIPVHIAFIPILIPPLLKVFNELGLDRRLIATVITFGLTAPYILLPFGFGNIFHKILLTNMAESGLEIEKSMIPQAMIIPTLGMAVGLLIAVFVSYRKNRSYENIDIVSDEVETDVEVSKVNIIFALIAIASALVFQIITNSMIIGAIAGIVTIYVGFFFNRNVQWKETDDMLTEGMRMMAFIGFVMIAASGFASVLRETGHVALLVDQAVAIIGDNKALAAIIMLVVGLLVTMGIGSSFSTIPIIATIFVPLALQLGFSPLATTALVGAAAALGDAGSPASDSTLGPTSGLNADGQHNHIWDTCVPTFLHYNIPLVIFGWIAAVVL
ncbi:Na+/H+ antiporter family protein [Bacillus solimangrovi]|uniref:Sodium:proton antiporter n=1 Tax=Bacillus solimangrovi TaxID=1305675 RepID=A0A1E5LIU4_9BACI|nr:Na+/H+ antiporter NhaC family protein [Bacillus solimangrovi]OEH93995.1 sodium:proton antiporter [Bacillus solimangrovi]